MAIRTNHTVLVKVTSHKSGGRSKMIYGNAAIVKRYTDPALTSNHFLRYELGTFLTVNVMLSGKRRLIKNVRLEPDADTIEKFVIVYGEKIAEEDKTFSTLHGIEGKVDDLRKAREQDFIDQLAEEKTKIEPEDISEWITKTYIERNDEEVLNTIRVLARKRHVALMMIGPSGYGKTSIPEQKAKDWGMEFLRWDCATVRDPEEFFGFRGAVDGSTMDDEGETIFSESKFTEIVQRGNCVIVLDELNRIDPYISNILFPLLDHAGKTSVVGHDVVVGPNVIFFATVNLGFQFTGTFTMDTALVNRFTAKILVGALPKEIEMKVIRARSEVSITQAEVIVRLMDGLRQLNEKGQLAIDASTRVSIQIAELVGCGLPLKAALKYVVVNGASEDEAKVIIDQVGFVTS